MIARLKSMPFAFWTVLPFTVIVVASLAWKTAHAVGWSGPAPAWLTPDDPFLVLVFTLALISGEQIRAARGLPPMPIMGVPLRHWVVVFIALAAFMLIMDAAVASASPAAPGCVSSHAP